MLHLQRTENNIGATFPYLDKFFMKYIILALSFFLLFEASVFSQQIRGAICGGFNISQVDGDEVWGWKKYGFNVGPSAIIPFVEKWSVVLETIYTQKGSYQKPQFAEPKTGEYKLILDYVEVPVLVMFTDKGFMSGGMGFSWGRIVDFQEYEHGDQVGWDSPYGPYKRDDVNILLDVRFPVYKRLNVNFRYAYSLAKIRTRTFLTGEVRDQFNTSLTFRLIYVFGKAIDAGKKKDRDQP